MIAHPLVISHGAANILDQAVPKWRRYQKEWLI